MIIPARWYAGGKRLDEFRSDMLSNTALSHLVDIRDASEAFAGVDIKGGVCYFRWDRDKVSPGCEFMSFRSGQLGVPVTRNLADHDVLIRDNQALSIFEKVKKVHDGAWLSAKVSSREPFVFPTNFSDFQDNKFDGAVKIFARGRIGWLQRDLVPDENEWVDAWKVLTPKAADGSGVFPMSVLGRPIVAGPMTCCSGTYLVVDALSSQVEAVNLSNFLKGKFSRFLVSLRKNTQDVTKSKFSFVPDLPMNKPWSDEKLYAHFGITPEEQAFINGMIREM